MPAHQLFRRQRLARKRAEARATANRSAIRPRKNTMKAKPRLSQPALQPTCQTHNPAPSGNHNKLGSNGNNAPGRANSCTPKAHHQIGSEGIGSHRLRQAASEPTLCTTTTWIGSDLHISCIASAADLRRSDTQFGIAGRTSKTRLCQQIQHCGTGVHGFGRPGRG